MTLIEVDGHPVIIKSPRECTDEYDGDWEEECHITCCKGSKVGPSGLCAAKSSKAPRRQARSILTRTAPNVWPSTGPSPITVRSLADASGKESKVIDYDHPERTDRSNRAATRRRQDSRHHRAHACVHRPGAEGEAGLRRLRARATSGTGCETKAGPRSGSSPRSRHCGVGDYVAGARSCCASTTVTRSCRRCFTTRWK